jgi:hypothetical protein
MRQVEYPGNLAGRLHPPANLAIEDSAFDFQVFSDPDGKLCESAEGVSLFRYKFTLAIVDMRQRPKAIDLEFVNEKI